VILVSSSFIGHTALCHPCSNLGLPGHVLGEAMGSVAPSFVQREKERKKRVAFVCKEGVSRDWMNGHLNARVIAHVHARDVSGIAFVFLLCA